MSQCSPASRLTGYDSLPQTTQVCDIPPQRIGEREVFINALHDSMPECDRATHSATLETLGHASHCYVYCAQRSCHAAVRFMDQHEEALRDGCDSITYLRNGALGMPETALADGRACHANILAHNEVQTAGCLNCDLRAETAVTLRVDGEVRENATYLPAKATAPEWFKRVSIWSRLPPQFSRDPRYSNHPQTHDPSGSTRVRFETTGTGLSEDALLAFWASKPDDHVREAHDAYDDFTNSGIVQCDRTVCEFTVDAPGAYTSEGKVFQPHIHVAEWNGDHWGGVGTITL